MPSLSQQLPDIEYLLSLENEELASHLLVALRDQRQNNKVILGNYLSSLFNRPGWDYGYADRSREAEVVLAVIEAWNWLEVQGLLVPDGSSEWRLFSRRAETFLAAADVRQFAQSRRIPKDKLHPRIADRVWSAFMRGEFDVAVFQAMKTVEVYVREATGSPADLIGVKLMRKAFADDGALSDPEMESSEREARTHLFAGAIGAFKNSLSHRDVNIDDPDEAYELVMLANHLLRIVDKRAAAKK
ncbi:TIGR02391 family protein [Bradyrhizobium barranii subsp. barranii]|uniref:TIGR02391 family protein n=1 Tax=Bradyrhizobium barranii subsp. barranii TaxID=2823807 RepID=A0A7Z0Q709_9BRAD|nr:TIGR02391 family protein [Bradyrhizobium barranii]UGX95783.1 TIGR02391 family protein [Bradyrhizobium barranii subsp. barranii]